MIKKKRDAEAHSVNRSSRRHPSRVVMVSRGGRAAPQKPMPKWKMGYVGFKRKVTVSYFIFAAPHQYGVNYWELQVGIVPFTTYLSSG